MTVWWGKPLSIGERIAKRQKGPKGRLCPFRLHLLKISSESPASSCPLFPTVLENPLPTMGNCYIGQAATVRLYPSILSVTESTKLLNFLHSVNINSGSRRKCELYQWISEFCAPELWYANFILEREAEGSSEQITCITLPTPEAHPIPITGPGPQQPGLGGLVRNTTFLPRQGGGYTSLR